MWRVTERLYLGDYRSGADALAGTAAVPVTGLVSLCQVPLLAGVGPDRPASPLTEWLLIPIQDGGNGEEEFEAAVGVAIPFIERRLASGNVLVHCAAGMSRSVSVVAAYLCKHGLDVRAAFRRIALSKARALGAPADLADELIAPCWEFRACLERLHGRHMHEKPGDGRGA
jgi:Dual specificity phosphatase, catalytic domain